MKKIMPILSILLLCACGYDEYKMPKEAYINLNDNSIEIYDINSNINDLIKDTNTKIINKNKSLNTKKLGKNKITIEYEYEGRKYKYDTNYNVVDTTKPVFLSAPSYINIFKGDNTDFCKNVIYADNYDRNVKCSIEGEIDNNIADIYNLKYVLIDSSNNKEEKDFTVNVIDENTSYDDNDDYYEDEEDDSLYFSDIIKNYKTTDNMIGIDVSAWQDEIDFEKVKKSGCEFVIIRIGVNPDIDRDLSIDSFYKTNIKKAKKAGLKVGVYVYTTAINEKKAKEHAKWVVKTLDKEKLDFPVAFDFENWSDFTSYKISTYDITNSFLVFKNYLKKNGYDAMLYSSLNYLNKVWMYKDTYDVWLAHYIDKTTYTGKYILWQMGNTGIIDGIDGYVDIDIYYKE